MFEYGFYFFLTQREETVFLKKYFLEFVVKIILGYIEAGRERKHLAQ